MSEANIGYVTLNAKRVAAACKEIVTVLEENRTKSLEAFADGILRDHQPGWIARNIFRRKPLTTREEALEYAPSINLGTQWYLWDLRTVGPREAELKRLRRAAEAAYKNAGSLESTITMTVSAKAAGWLADYL